MMRTIRQWISGLTIRWKMVLWSSFMLIVLFTAYNFAQYAAVHQWMVKQEKASIQKTMAQLVDYFQEKGPLNENKISNSIYFLEKLNEKNQLIRILNRQGDPIVTVTDQLPESYVTPETTDRDILLSAWHFEDHLLVMRSPLISGDFRGTIEIVNNLETFDQFSAMIFWVMILAGCSSVLLSALGGYLLVNQFLKPVQSLADAIRNVKQKGLHERVEQHQAKDELSRLAALFNDLMSELETSFKQQKQFVEDASHELRTPIAIMKGHLSLLDRWGKNDPEILDKSLMASLQELHRLEGIVQELLTLTRSENELPSEEIAWLKPVRLLERTVKRFAVLHPEKRFVIELGSISDEIMIKVVPQHLEQVLLILLDNAVKYSASGTTITLHGRIQDDSMLVEVRDQGMGIPSEELPHVFDRFYRVDKARSREQGGTGLGLAIAKRLVERNGGGITIDSREKEGTTVTLSFPLVVPISEG
ncbi:HAMP domain-containing sensor histidine kinase [Paenibacillus vulneris]|uniref:Signal transduction histidine-protein kinase ArlS n=1 Tax=Paenibacillus vulneris TaxID=1133364 RepID=A0ABW3USD5_9BACL